MDAVTAATRLASLGHELRIELFRLLVQAGPAGLAVGELQALVDRPASTVAFHLKAMVDSTLVTQVKEGRVVRCHANFAALNELLLFLRHDCCRGVALPAFGTRRSA